MSNDPTNNGSAEKSILDMLAHPESADIDFEPPRMCGAEARESDVAKGSYGCVSHLMELLILAQEVFGSSEAAKVWMNKPHPCFEDLPPSQAVSTYGAKRVMEVLTAIKYGGVV